MTNAEQGTPKFRKYRYPIRQLLELSKSACLPFDLSKFSYDAARAGVVPPLSDCVMNSRRSSSQRTRKWSTEATSTAEGSGIRSANQVQYPIRDPRVPPTELRAQKDEGFAYFLKKHASPPHKRVTAGGRIVPMEPRSAPPQFELGPTRSNQPAPQNNSQAFCNNNGSDMTAESLYKVHTYINQSEPQAHTNGHSVYPYHPGIGRRSTAFETAPQGPIPILPSHGLNTRPDFIVPTMGPAYAMTSLGFTTSHDGSIESSQAMYNFASQGFPSSATPLPQGPYMMHNWNQPQCFPQQEMMGYHASAQSSLTYWSQYFDELDRQLKALDRQRATTSLTQSYAEQRRHIVQQRADTKAIINKLQSFLGMSEKVVEASHAVFNVNAPSYVPAVQQTPAITRSNRTSRSTEEGNLSVIDSEDKPRLPGAKRPIPIVPPPKSPEFVQNRKRVDTSASVDGVDAWGVKVGKAPPELERQQSQMLECLVESTSSSSSRASSQVNLVLPRKSFSENDAIARRTNSDDSSDDEEILSPFRAGRAPPHVEAAYELQLDALRQPRGVMTVLHMPDGTSMTVEGQDLQRPPTSGMSEFERQYWSRKQYIIRQSVPSDSSGSVSNTGSVQTPSSYTAIHTDDSTRQSGKENVTVAPVGHRRAATEAFLAQFNDDVNNRSPSPHDDTQSLRDLGLAQNDRNRQILQDIYGTGDNNRNSVMKESSTPYAPTYDYPATMYGYQDGDNVRPSELAEEQNMPAESMFNKGYSSVSIQNVHALAHLPQNLDGSNEDKRGAKALLGLAQKAKSPRLLQRSGMNGNAWFGPFRRDACSSEPVSPVRSIKRALK